MIFFQKQLRPCQAEFVNTLLYIPHHEPVKLPFLFPGHRLQQIFLYQIAVLILVDENFRKMLPVLQCHTAGNHLPLLSGQQNVQGKMLHIGKVYHLLFSLFLRHSPVEIQNQADEGAHRLPALQPLLHRQLQRRLEKFFRHPLNAFFHFRPQFPG